VSHIEGKNVDDGSSVNFRTASIHLNYGGGGKSESYMRGGGKGSYINQQGASRWGTYIKTMNLQSVEGGWKTTGKVSVSTEKKGGHSFANTKGGESEKCGFLKGWVKSAGAGVWNSQRKGKDGKPPGKKVKT